MSRKVTVRVSNAYECGLQSGGRVEVASPSSDERLEAWWDRVVLPQTGDGHQCGASFGGFLHRRTLPSTP